MKTKIPMKRISRLVARHLKQGQRGRGLLTASRQTLEVAMSLGMPVDVPIEIRENKEGVTRRVVLRDRFAKQNEAYASKVFQRYKVEDWKEPKKAGETATK